MQRRGEADSSWQERGAGAALLLRQWFQKLSAVHGGRGLSREGGEFPSA